MFTFAILAMKWSKILAPISLQYSLWSGFEKYLRKQASDLIPNKTAESVAVIQMRLLFFLTALNAASRYKFGVPKGSIEMTLGLSLLPGFTIWFWLISENKKLASLLDKTISILVSLSLFNSKFFIF